MTKTADELRDAEGWQALALQQRTRIAELEGDLSVVRLQLTGIKREVDNCNSLSSRRRVTTMALALDNIRYILTGEITK